VGRYVVRRAVQAAVTLLGVATIVFFVVRLSGDPAALLLGEQARDAELAALRTELGLDRPLPVQYLQFMAGVLRGDLGVSIRQGEPALLLVAERLPATVQLAIVSFVVGIALAFGLGVLIQMIDNSHVTEAIMWLAFARQAIPVFWFGLLLVLVFSVTLGWLPAIGSGTWAHFVLPVATLATFELALYLRLFNSGFGEQLRQDYTRTSRAKGLSERIVVLRHALPNVLLPIITIAGINFGVLLSGTVVTETVFSYPGVGRLVVQAVQQRDYPVIQATMVVVSAIFVLVNFAVDVLYAYTDPRVRLG
jgi:peptide/nickel transport system permease protein